jgi:PIN domain nuclease of toxin-antitoxin system
MTKYLLDTHVVLWLMFDIDKLPIKILEEIKNFDNEIYISAVSFWEISIKYSLGKLNLNKFNPSELPKVYLEQGFKFLPLSIAETSTLCELNMEYHKDPFDRMLIWQAIKNDFILISNDINIPAYRTEGLKLVW